MKPLPAVKIEEDGFAFQRTGAAPHGSSFVEYSWAITARRCRIAVEAVLPDPAVEVFFNFGPSGRCVGDRADSGSLGSRRAWVVGPHQETLLVSKETADCNILGVRLAPAVAAQLFRVPVSELAGQMVDLELLWPDADALADRLFAADRRQRFALVEQAIRARLEHACAGTRQARALAVRVAASSPGLSIGRLARELGVAHRTLIATFLAQVGLRPKTYQRVARLRRTFRLLEEDGLARARVALLAGYYDQAHLANEFRQMTGMTPAQYSARRSWVSDGVVPFRMASGTLGG